MAEIVKKGVIVEFDFAAMDGANLLFDVTKKFLAGLDNIPFDERIEAQHLAGGNYQGGLAEYFAVVKTKKLAAKAAKDLSAAFVSALNEAVPKSVTPAFRKFVQTIAAKGVKIVISTRADVETVRPAFAGLLGDDVVLFQETSSTYGSVKWDAWRRACAMNKLRNFSTIAVTGSGFGVKSALVAGMGSVAVTSPHVAYQDFGGADEVVSELNAAAAKTILEILRA
jgi:phosphoglycolate phosphatase-like HAD superfamily hydrolase